MAAPIGFSFAAVGAAGFAFSGSLAPPMLNPARSPAKSSKSEAAGAGAAGAGAEAGGAATGAGAGPPAVLERYLSRSIS